MNVQTPPLPKLTLEPVARIVSCTIAGKKREFRVASEWEGFMRLDATDGSSDSMYVTTERAPGTFLGALDDILGRGTDVYVIKATAPLGLKIEAEMKERAKASQEAGS